MSKNTYIDAVRVASPCDAEWDEMTGNDQVRFCGHCSKSVTDLSTFRRKDAAKLVRAANGELCIRYIPNQKTNQPMFAEQLVQIARRAPRLATGVLSASISLATLAYGQSDNNDENKPEEVTQVIKSRNALELTTLPYQPNTVEDKTGGVIHGVIRDRQGKPVPGVLVYLASESYYDGESTYTNEDGEYRFDELEPETYMIRVQTTTGELRKAAPGVVIAANENVVLDLNVRTHIKYVDGNGFGTGSSSGEGFGGASIAISYRSPLFDAVADNNVELVKKLLIAGAKINENDDNYSDITPIFLAVENGNVEITKLLLQYGAKVNAKNDSGRTPLMFIDDDATPELIRTLFLAGAKINVSSKDGETPLIAAASYENADAVKTLIELGADLGAADEEGMTALMTAVKNESADTVSVLIAAGADINTKNKAGDTAWDITSDTTIEKMLVDAGAFANYDVEVEVEIIREDEPPQPSDKPAILPPVQAKDN
ncbi:MAG TPA: ankyrin repeat domain-containing protein [Pyrinomonadaceae bacterium]|nr:ankyrin repeat domain-containing protein [Pyrinomonadaceae bacterium]